MSVFEFEDRNEPLMRENLKSIGAMNNLSAEYLVHSLRRAEAPCL